MNAPVSFHTPLLFAAITRKRYMPGGDRCRRLAAAADVLPVAVVIFELVAEPYLLGRDKAESRVVDLQIARPRRQTDEGVGPGPIVASAVGRDLLDRYRRWHGIDGNAAWIDDAQPVDAFEPQSPVP